MIWLARLGAWRRIDGEVGKWINGQVTYSPVVQVVFVEALERRVLWRYVAWYVRGPQPVRRGWEDEGRVQVQRRWGQRLDQKLVEGFGLG